MAREREEVCVYYVAYGVCKKGRDASQKGYCQKCDKYEPRSRRRHINKKRAELEKLLRKETPMDH